ncbi:MAG: hypothetical protein HYX33_00945 [Actinobacteria bacterium]|nr:hypothetical protein [Actinomycetota bacterium]
MLRSRAAALTAAFVVSSAGTAVSNPVPPGWVPQPCVVVDAAPLTIDASTGVATATATPGTVSGEWMRIYCPPGVTLGAPGPVGPAGAQGPQGVQGFPGPAGVSAAGRTPAEPARATELARVRRELRRARASARRWERAARAARARRPAPRSPIVLG